MESIICTLGVVEKCYTNNFALIESLWTLREGDNSLMYSISKYDFVPVKESW